MPFIDSNTIRPLYDNHDGGPPCGFKCMCSGNQIDRIPYKITRDGRECNRVTRTLAGMRTHQRIVHGIKPQQEIDFEHTALNG